MSSDLFTLKVLAGELDRALKGARLDKIQQPEEDELRFFLRAPGKNLCLTVSCNAGAPGIRLTDTKKTSPVAAPAFLMLLRKHLASACVEEVSVFENDRIIRVKFRARTEMKDDAEYYLFAEIMSRYSNIVFTDGNMRILESVKRLAMNDENGHAVLRGLTYRPVEQTKTSYLTVSFDVFDNISDDEDLHRFILNNISGFSGATAQELLYMSGLSTHSGKLTDEEKARLCENIEKLRNPEDNGLYSPCVSGGKDVLVFPYATAKGEKEYFDSLSRAFDKLTGECDRDIRNKARLKNLASAAKRLRQRAEKNIGIDNAKLTECKDMDKYRVWGELIVANIYKIKKGDKKLECLDYYSGEECVVPLDERLSPSKNSASYYNKYNKLKRAKEFTEKKLAQDLLMLEYIKSVEAEIAALPYGASSEPIEEELRALGAVKKQSKNAKGGKVRKPATEPPYAYECEGFVILKGRNNIQNDELTFKTASSSDIWVHLKNEHGAHVIILTEGREVPVGVIKVAGEIAASDKRAAMEVDYTARRNVKRQPNGHYGQVIYVNYKTMVSEPCAHEELKLK